MALSQTAWKDLVMPLWTPKLPMGRSNEAKKESWGWGLAPVLGWKIQLGGREGVLQDPGPSMHVLLFS